MRRLFIYLLPLVLVALSASAWHWLLHTEHGARWMWERVSAATGGALRVQELTGDLASGVTMRQFRFSADSTELLIAEIRLVADVDLIPFQVQISDAVVDNVRLNVLAADAESPQTNVRSVLELLSLPITIDINDLRLGDVIMTGVLPDRDVSIDEAIVAANWHEDINVDHLTIVTADASAELSGALELEQPFTTHFAGRLSAGSTLTGYPHPVIVQLNGDGDLDHLAVSATSSPVELTLQGSIHGIFESPSWDLQLELVEFSRKFGVNEFRFTDARAATAGDLNEYSLTAATTIEAPGQQPVRMAITSTGNPAGLEIPELALRSADARAEGSARLSWGENWSIESQLDIETLNLHAWLEAWPAENPIHGKLRLQLNEQYLAFNDTYLAVESTDMSARVDAELDLAASVVAGDLHWENVRWPVAGDGLIVSSETGSVSVDGSLDDWRVNGQIAAATATIPTGEFRIDGHGDRNHIQGTIVDSEVLGGTAAGYAAYDWREQQWSAGIDVAGIDIGSLFDRWPGFVSGRVDFAGQQQPFQVDLELTDINGTLRDAPLAASGQLTFTKRQVTAHAFSLSHGESSASLDGSVLDQAGITFDISVNELASYVGEAAGSFEAAGVLSLHDQRPFLRIDARSSAVGYKDVQVTDVVIADRSGVDSMINAEVTAARLSVAGNIIEDVSLRAIADTVSQSLQFDATYGTAQAHLLVDGEFDDPRMPSAWNGHLREFELAYHGEAAARLTSPAALGFSADAMSVGRACLVGSHGMRLCAAASRLATRQYEVSADLTDVPLNLVNSLIDTRLAFDQLISGNFELRQEQDSSITGNADMTLSAGTIVSVDRPDLTIDTGSSLLKFDIVKGQLLSGNAALPMPGFGHVNARFSVPDFAKGMNSGIAGVFDVDISDIALLAAFSTLIDEAHGTLRADLELSGTVSKPLVAGDLSITGGSMTYLPIGLRADEVDITSQLHENGQIGINGTFRAGEGRGEIISRADDAKTFTKGFKVELRGSNLTLIDVTDMQMRADLNVQVGFDRETLTLGGRVMIPHARIKPSNLNITRDSESEDVIIVAGELPEHANQMSAERELKIAGSLEMALGNDLLIDLGLATANLTGSTVFTWNDGLIPMADGNYDLTGSVQAFGQVLEITEGGLRFPKIPADNPFIRVRAEREIYGNPQVKTAGILVDGTVRRPTIGAYTRPLTTEERALALLVTGSDFDFEQGVGAIDFGTYIAPRVFVSYGVALFERENVIRVRYDLMRGFGITATSGQKESGLDLNYRLER